MKLTRLFMVAVKGHGQYRGGEDVENDDINIRVSLDQSEHSEPFPAWLARLLVSPRVSLDRRNLAGSEPPR